jgi:TolB-like protein
MHRLFLLAGLLLAASAPWADSIHHRSPTLAVVPFTAANADAAKDGLGLSMASMFGTHLKNETSFIVVERSQVARILGEKAMTESGVTETQRRELGKLLNVEAILTGEVSRFGNLIQVDARLVSVESGQVLVAEYAEVDGYGKLRGAVLQISKNLELKYLRQWMGDLSVAGQPVDAEVYLDGQFCGKATLKEPLKVSNLLEGRYALKVIAGGYRTAVETVSVEPRGLHETQIALKALPGSLRLFSEPAGASVRVNGKEAGEAPVTLDTVSEGRYRVQFDLHGFQPFDREVEVRSGQQSEVKAALQVLPGRLVVSSVPSGAVAWLDDRRVGTAPVAVDNVVPGTHTVRLESPGRSPVKDVVVVRPGEEVPWSGSLDPLTGFLTVVPKTDSVQVSIFDSAGREAGRVDAPFHRRPLGIGRWNLLLRRPLHKDVHLPAAISEGHETRFEPVLPELPATLEVVSDGAPAEIVVDGQWMGRSPVAASELSRGLHVVRWRSFFDQGTDTVALAPDQRGTAHVRARRDSAERWMIPLGIVLSTLLLFVTDR